MIGRGSAAVREFALYGETTGEIDEFGLPVRANWAADYRGNCAVVYGHTPVVEFRVGQQHDLHRHWMRVIFGGQSSPLRSPERELIEVSAIQQYC